MGGLNKSGTAVNPIQRTKSLRVRRFGNTNHPARHTGSQLFQDRTLQRISTADADAKKLSAFACFSGGFKQQVSGAGLWDMTLFYLSYLDANCSPTLPLLTPSVSPEV